MRKGSARNGSALMMAVIVVIIAAGLGGAFWSMSIHSGKRAEKLTSEAEAQQICDAALEIARSALVQWRNADQHITTAGQGKNPAFYAWNKVFQRCVDADTARMGMGAVASADVIREDALTRFSTMPQAWAVSTDNTYSPLTTNSTTIGTCGPNDSTTIGQGIQELFGVNRRYGKGCFHLSFRNNTGDRHGDGVDNRDPALGNCWFFDPAYSKVDINNNSIVYYPGDANPGPWGSGSIDPMVDGDGQAILTITATLPDGTCRQIEVFLAFPFQSGGPVNAIQDNGDISMQGNFRVMGTMGNVFANGNITGNGSANAQVSGAINAAGSATVSMQNTPLGGVNSGVPPIAINPIDVTQFLTDAKHSRLRNNMYVLKSNGTAAKMSGTSQAPTGTPQGWKFQGGKWVTFGATPPIEAVYYIEGDFSQQGAAPDMAMTIIATGSVTLGGNAKFTASRYYNGTAYEESTGQLVVAGADIKLAGNGVVGDTQYKGSFWANEQVKIQGTFDMNGSITGANATDTPGSAVSSSSALSDPDLTIGGTPTIIYNGGGSIIVNGVDHLNVQGIHRTR